MFLATLHLMLAAVTRYAVGLLYQPENVFDDLEGMKTAERFDEKKEYKSCIEMLFSYTDGIFSACRCYSYRCRSELLYSAGQS